MSDEKKDWVSTYTVDTMSRRRVVFEKDEIIGFDYVATAKRVCSALNFAYNAGRFSTLAQPLKVEK